MTGATACDALWRDGNHVRLLENGEQYFARAFDLIEAARREVMLETFILFEDAVGIALKDRLVGAARRGVRIHALIDAYGSPDLSDGFVAELTGAGVELRMFDPKPRLLGIRTNVFRRLHRKLLLVDGCCALVGGINFSADHLLHSGPRAKQDYAVEVAGPVVADIEDFMRHAAANDGTGEGWMAGTAYGQGTQAGTACASFLPRDNRRRTTSIEHAYRSAFRTAEREIIIANAYFFPGHGFLRELCDAARRGVQVSLLFQGQPDKPLALKAARALYRHLAESGVQLHEYCERPFHGKVAVIDGQWSTVGSSNLDPLSLSLNLEANLFVRDASFAADLRARLRTLIEDHCRRIDPEHLPPAPRWHVLARPLVFHVLRHMPRWAGQPRADEVAAQSSREEER